MRRLLVLHLAAMCAAAATAAFAGAAGAATAAGTIASDDALAQSVLIQINAFRTAHALRPLVPSKPLTTAAAAQSASMGSHGFFDHDSFGGGAFWKRIERSYPSRGYRTWTVGENLLWSTDVDAQQALALWVASPHHLENLLNPAWREIGISAVRAAAAPGVFAGQDVSIITTDFGARR